MVRSVRMGHTSLPFRHKVVQYDGYHTIYSTVAVKYTPFTAPHMQFFMKCRVESITTYNSKVFILGTPTYLSPSPLYIEQWKFGKVQKVVSVSHTVPCYTWVSW